MKLNEFVNQRRKELNMSVDELVKKSGIPKGTLSKITAGINSNPTLSTVESLCKALNCSLNDIAGNVQVDAFSLSEKSIIQKYRELDSHGKKIVDMVLNEEYDRCTVLEEQEETPVIEIRNSVYKVSAGTGCQLDDEAWEIIEIPDTYENRQADFTLTISGNSMEPIYHDGDIVLVKEQPQANMGEIGIFIINGEGFIKKYGGDRLISLNDDYEDIVLSENNFNKYCGKVIGRL